MRPNFAEADEKKNEYKQIYEQFVECANLGVNIDWETLQQSKILRVTKKYLAKQCPEMFAKIAERNEDYMKFYVQIVEFLRTGSHKNLAEDVEVAELVKYNTLKPQDEQIRSKEYTGCKKEEQNDNYDITGVVLIPECLLDVYPETAEKYDDYKELYEQSAECTKPGAHKNSVDGLDTAELVRFNTSKYEDEQNYNYDITGEITVPERLKFEDKAEPKDRMEARFIVIV